MLSTELPLISCVLSSYNRPRLIRDALDSILAQTWPNIEVVIADDHSDDAVGEVICEYGRRTPCGPLAVHAQCGDGSVVTTGHFFGGWVKPRKVPTLHERQFGQRTAVCINAMMPFVRGDFVAFLCDDDFLVPNSIEVRARFLMANPLANVVYGKLCACISEIPVPGMHWEATPQCRHDDTCFWSAEPIARAANRLDHNMPMVRCAPALPQWPEDRGVAAAKLLRANLLPSLWPPHEVDCPDAAWMLVLEAHGFGPFYSVPDVVAVKRYTNLGHRSDPRRRE